MSTTNSAAWLNAAGQPLAVGPAPFPSPSPNEVIIKTSAVAINPIDSTQAQTGLFVKAFPMTLGHDLAGTIAAVGSAVTSFSIGDRVIGSSQGALKGEARYGAFQLYIALPLPCVSRIPAGMNDTDAVVLPLGVDTASAMLFQKEHLALEMPPTTAGKGKTVMVWGGSTSVGSCAIQLLKNAGYEAVVMAGKANFEFCKALGAATVLDYSSADIEAELSDAVKGKILDGAICCVKSVEAHEIMARVLVKAGGRKVVSSVMSKAKETVIVEEVAVDSVFATTIAFNEVGPQIWGKFLPEALEKGTFVARPSPIIIEEQGLGAIQAGIERWRAGVSAQKVVVRT